MKKKILFLSLVILGITSFMTPEVYAGTHLGSSTIVGDYRKDVWIHDDGSRTIYMIDSEDRVISVTKIAADGTLLSVLP